MRNTGFSILSPLSKINFGYASAAGMPHVAHHGKDAVYGQ